MPAKNSIKDFVENSYYHLYNRGVEKRIIFVDAQDYDVFLSYIKTYLLPKDITSLQSTLSSPKQTWAEKSKALKLLRLNNFSDTIDLIAYCLMPNHFHLLVKQTSEDAIDHFMNSFCTRYAMYFNRKYKRVGVLFQDVYKAVRIESDEQLLHLSRYIHKNPEALLQVLQGDPLQKFPYSSFREYIGIVQSEWIKPKVILEFFALKGTNSYQSFVVQKQENEYPILGHCSIDWDEA